MPPEPPEEGDQQTLVDTVQLYSNLLATSLFYCNPWILKEEILKCEFLHQPCALRSEFRLIYIKHYNIIALEDS